MLIQTREQFDAALTVLFDADVIAIDTETEFIPEKGLPDLLGIACYSPIKGRDGFEAGFYFPFGHQHSPSLIPSVNIPKEWLRDLRAALDRDNYTPLFHNAKFDLKILRAAGIDLEELDFWDTMLMHHMVDENPPHGLKQLGKSLLGIEDKEKKALDSLAATLGGGRSKAHKAEGWKQIPPDAMGLYAVQDVRLTYLLYKFLLEEMEKQELLQLWPREQEFCRFLLAVETNGVLINARRTLELREFCQQRRAEIQSDLGFDPMKPDQLAHRLFGATPLGLGFPPGPLGEPSSQFPSGRPRMDKHILGKYEHPVVDSVLEYRGLVKAESTWFEGFLSARWPDGRVHPDYRQHGTVTTRLSCAQPNMQQLPREAEDGREDVTIKEKVKSILEAPDGYEIWEYDYSQLEPRLATCYSKEPALLFVYQNGLDVYQETADAVGITRYEAKQLWLAMMYGAGVKKVAEMLGRTQKEAAEIVSRFRSSYPKLAGTIDDVSKAATQRGWIRLWTGRKRHFQWPSEAYKAFNSLMQGGGAEIVKDSCIKVMEIEEVRPIATVHDSIWFEVPVNRPDLHEKIKATMEWPNAEFPIPFPVEGKRLSHSEEVFTV